MGTCGAKVVCLLLITLKLAAPSLGLTYVVPWTKGLDLTTYTLGKEFRTGDVLNFQYTAGVVAVYQVNAQGFTTCDITKGGTLLGNNGNTFFTLRTATIYYFVSYPLDCASGLKLLIKVPE